MYVYVHVQLLLCGTLQPITTGVGGWKVQQSLLLTLCPHHYSFTKILVEQVCVRTYSDSSLCRMQDVFFIGTG